MGMEQVSLFALGIDRVRDIFSGRDDLSRHLRDVAIEHFCAKKSRKRLPLIQRLGPLSRRPAYGSLGNDPVNADVDDLLAGRFIEPSRLDMCWRILLVWMSDLSYGHVTVPMGFNELDAIDFDLARAGLAAEYSLGSLFNRNPLIPIRPGAGMRVGYARHAGCVEMTHQLGAALSRLDEIDPPSRVDSSSAVTIREFLSHLPEWAAIARDSGDYLPDVFAVAHG